MDSGSMGSALQHKGMKTGRGVPCLLLLMVPAAAPEMGRGWRRSPGSDWRGSSAGKATGWSWGQGQSILFSPSTWEAAVGFLVFMYLIVHDLPQLHLQAGICSTL